MGCFDLTEISDLLKLVAFANFKLERVSRRYKTPNLKGLKF